MKSKTKPGMNVFASYEFCEEVCEEEERVSSVRRFCLPERWFVPAPATERDRKPWNRTAGLPRSAKCYALPGRKKPLDQIGSYAPDAEREVLCSELTNDPVDIQMAVLFRIRPTNVYQVYRKALEEKQTALAELIPYVVEQLKNEGALSRDAVSILRGTFGQLAKTCPIANHILAAVTA